MPIGTSDGQYFENIFDYHRRMSDANEMRANETSGDFQSRFLASNVPNTSQVPPEALRKAGDALVLQGEGYTPEKPVEFNSDLDNSRAAFGTMGPAEIPFTPPPVREKPPAGKTLFETKAGPITEGDIGNAIDVAMNFSGGGLTFQGIRSKTFSRNDLGEATIMEMQGAHRDEIHAKTGMFRGADNRWRSEIDDSQATFKEGWQKDAPKYPAYGKDVRIVELPEIYNHPELFKAYPFLQKTEVIYDPKHSSAAMLPGTNSIVLGAANNKGAVMHEVQHLIQEYEGFAQGGSPGTAGKEYQLRYQEAFDNLNNAVTPIAKKIEAGKEITPEERQLAMRFLGAFEKFPAYKKAGDDLARENYMNLAGEVEARNVETREFLSAKERRDTPPYATEDNFRENQIIVRESSLTTPYGAWDQRAGKYVKPQNQ